MMISNSKTILLQAPVEKAFPLFGPIREKDWADGWDPFVIHAESDVHEYMAFITESSYEVEKQYLWVVSYYDSASFSIRYHVSGVDRSWVIAVTCNPVDDSACTATVTYTYFAANQSAHSRNVASIQHMFAEDLRDWQMAINHFLRTGLKLKS